jgi:hypothetical protein
MARPVKQTVDYFPHVCDTDNGKTLSVLQNKYGNDGYAFWFRLLEFLGKRSGLYFDYSNPADLEFLCAKTHQNNTETILKMLADLDVLGAIDHELYQEQVIWCQNFVEGVKDAFARSVSGPPVRPAPKTVNVQKTGDSVLKTGDSVDRNPQNGTETPQRKGKEIKVNKTKDPPTVPPPPEPAPGGASPVEEKPGKEIYGLPDYVDANTWDDYLAMRKKKRAAPTDRAVELIIKDLAGFHGEGYDVNKLLEMSIKNSWIGVFPRKEFLSGKAGQNPQRTKYVEAPKYND